MNVATDMTIRQKFTRFVDNEEEALSFGEEAAQYAYAFSRGFGEFELSEDS